jgi:predicted alpha/beta superfamily hydrolase
MNTNHSPATIMGAHKRTLASRFVDQEYELSIWVPFDYEQSEKDYPTLYVLDAPIFYGGAVYIAMCNNWDGVIPEMIVVGVGAQVKNWEEWDPLRDRDLSSVEIPGRPWSGHADNFIRFVEKELLPFVDSNYRTQRADRIIWGHSSGATFALKLMFHKTHLFNRIIATSPSFEHGGKAIYDYHQDLATDALPSKVRLFVSVGSLENTYSARARDFMRDLAERKMRNLQLHTMILDGFDHAAANFPGFIYGLRAVYGM